MAVSFHLFYLKESNSTNTFTNVNEYIFIHLWYGRCTYVYYYQRYVFALHDNQTISARTVP